MYMYTNTLYCYCSQGGYTYCYWIAIGPLECCSLRQSDLRLMWFWLCMSVRVGVLFRGRLPYTIFNSSYMSEDPAAPWEFDMAKPPGRTYKCDRSTLAS